MIITQGGRGFAIADIEVLRATEIFPPVLSIAPRNTPCD
jgi:hypothetical protein